MSTKPTDHAKAQLRQAGLKVTAGRVRLLELFSHTSKPLAMSDLSREMRGAAMDPATIYRTVQAFVGAGLVRQVNLERRQAYYELAAQDHHHHVVCVHCGRVQDLDCCSVQTMQRQVRGFHQILRHSVELFGVCQPCSKQRS